MEQIAQVLTIVLSAIFLTAGIAKLIDFEGAKEAAAGFGVPVSVAGAAMALLICLEILVAFTLLFGRTNRIGAVASCVLLIVFVLATSRLIIQGKSPECRCFGQLSSEPVGKSSLIRNAVLLAVAIAILLMPQPAYLTAGDEGLRGFGLTVAAFLLSGFLIASLLIALELRKRFDSIEARLETIESYSTLLNFHETAGEPTEGLPVGTKVPDISILGIEEGPVSVRGLAEEGLPVLMVFIGPECLPCASLAEYFPEWAEILKDKIRMVLISSGSEEVNIEKFGQANRALIYLQNNNEAAEALKAKWTPTALMMGANGRIASAPTAGDTAIKALIGQISQTDDLASPLFFGERDEHLSKKFGEEVPDFELETLDGGTYSNSNLLGHQTLVLFWSLTCSYCTEMLDELNKWNGEKEGMNLIVFADGPIEELQETGIGSGMVVDRGYKVAETFGMHGTPSAIIVDERGIIVSESAQGSEKINQLSGSSFDGEAAKVASESN